MNVRPVPKDRPVWRDMQEQVRPKNTGGIMTYEVADCEGRTTHEPMIFPPKKVKEERK